MRAWERIADKSHPEGQPHIYTEGDNWRFNMHMVDRDGYTENTDRQRQEVAGCRVDDSYLRWLSGETWRITYSMYLPKSLKATTKGSHIMQIKKPGTTLPLAVQSLRRKDGQQMIELNSVASNTIIGRTALEPLHDKWTDVDFRITIGNGKSGSIRWTLASDGTTVIDVARDGIDTLSKGERAYPRWGIYRYLDDDSGSLEDCYMLLTNPRAYQLI